jgi:hypothetical protein
VFAGGDADKLALELGAASEEPSALAPCAVGVAGPCVAERAEAGLLLGDGSKRVQQVARRGWPGQAGQARPRTRLNRLSASEH